MQGEMVTRALIAVIDQLEEPTTLRRNLHALGARHLNYGVTDEMYAWVGQCLLETPTLRAAS